MDKKAFRILKDVMGQTDSGFKVKECDDMKPKFKVLIYNAAKPRFHRDIQAFRATSPQGHELVVIKLPQHPARMLQADYGARCGEAVRIAAQQIAALKAVDVTVTWRQHGLDGR